MDFVTAEETIHRNSFHQKNNFTRENYKNIIYDSGNRCKGIRQMEKDSFNLQHHSEKSRSTCGLCGRLRLLTPTLAQSHGSIRQGALLLVDQDKKMKTLTSQLQSGPGTMISTWQGQFSDIFTTHHPKHISQKLLSAGTVKTMKSPRMHPSSWSRVLPQLWQIEMPRAPISLNPSLLIERRRPR